MEKLIYLDNAATTLHKPPQVAQAVAQAILTAGNAARGAHGASMQASRTVFETRRKLAQLLGCPRPEQVVFTANSTMALNIAIQGLLSPADHAISTDLEHNSVLRPLYALEAQGMGLSFVRADRQGRIRCEDFAPLFRPNTRAVVCTHASNLTGDLLDVARIAEIAHAHGALLILDASQTAGAIPIDMTALGVDVLCFTGHKGLMGPQGTGGLCIRPGVDIRPLLRGGSGVHSFDREQPQDYPTRLETGTLNSHGIAGLDAAADYLLIALQCEYLAMEGLGQIMGVVEQLRSAGVSDSLEVGGVIMTMYDSRTNLSKQVLGEVKNYMGQLVFKTLIPRTVRLAEAPSFGKTIFEYAKWNEGAFAYEKLAKEVDKRFSLRAR